MYLLSILPPLITYVAYVLILSRMHQRKCNCNTFMPQIILCFAFSQTRFCCCIFPPVWSPLICLSIRKSDQTIENFLFLVIQFELTLFRFLPFFNILHCQSWALHRLCMDTRENEEKLEGKSFWWWNYHQYTVRKLCRIRLYWDALNFIIYFCMA